MSRRSLLKLGLLLLLVLTASAAFLWWTKPANRINRSSFEKIEKGMTVKEVTEVIGVPPGDYSTKPMKLMGHVFDEIWWSDNGLILLSLDEAGRVSSKDFIRVNGATSIDKIRRWLHFD